ncbi:HD domain-containing protein [Granulicella aggregans]|uniref:HD domain-containing protein n=1 Tax=Granulicella aggregans TaxID=474949 RepID=UPI0021DFE574|nr:HD domain-containing protein [Granulicella aggregans]
MLISRTEAYGLLEQLGASNRLIRHAHFVSDAADSLLLDFRMLDVPVDVLTVQLGAVLHDAGKIAHPHELGEPGSCHEGAGEALLLAHHVQPEIARCCRSHAAWNLAEVTLEERIVALADKLWKGKREADLELLVIDETAARLGLSRWDIFERLDSAFEEIAASGSQRVEESRREIQ